MEEQQLKFSAVNKTMKTNGSEWKESARRKLFKTKRNV